MKTKMNYVLSVYLQPESQQVLLIGTTLSVLYVPFCVMAV